MSLTDHSEARVLFISKRNCW